MPLVRFINIFIIALLLATIQAPARADMLADMVRFDQAYLPAWILARNDDSRAQAAIEGLYDEWNLFKQQYAYTGSVDIQLNFDLDEIEWHVLEARRLILEGERAEAGRVLRPVRDIMMSMRAREGIDYYLDDFTRYHRALSRLIDILDDASSTHAGELARQSRVLFESWRRITYRDINPYEYGLDMERYEMLQQSLRRQEQQLLRLNASLRTADETSSLSLVRQLEQGLIDALACFGRFPS